MASEEIGVRVGDYEVLAPLGSGGMGRVYKVRNVISNREEAMKILLPDLASEPDLAARFMAEIRTLAGLEHPNIAQLRTAFQAQNQFVMVMELVEGVTLDKVAAEGTIPLDRAMDYSMQVLAALSYAHSRGVTHRDIKPGNIMITPHGVVKLMDFGIAKSANDLNLTRPGTTMGSIYYMAPEQVRGGAIDARSDIYSFGVLLYEMLTGRKPFQADTSYSVLNAQLNDPPTPPAEVNPALSPQLNDIVLRAMAKNPDERFQSADEFRNALRALREQPAAQPVPQPVPQPVQQGIPLPVPECQGYTPVAVVGSPAQAARSSSHRGLWMVLGAVAALLALAAAATLLPHFLATHAGQKPAPAADVQPISPAPASAGQTGATASNAAQQPNPPALVPTVASPASTATTSGPSVSPGASSRQPYLRPQHGAVSSAQAPAGAPASSPSVSSAPAAPAEPSPQEIHQTHDRMMNLDARASAASTGVEQIRSQQQAQGFDIRGDVLASMNRLNNFMKEADRALSQHDLQTANEYMDRADKEISTLESFLGR
jgi:serine/threonine-protein kinase